MAGLDFSSAGAVPSNGTSHSCSLTSVVPGIRKRTRTVATGYLNFLYSPLAQDLIGKNYYRPRNPQAAAKYAARFPKSPMVTINDTFGGWTKAQATHFADGGVFDQIHKG